MAPAVLIEGLQKSYGSVEAIKDVSLIIESGEIFGLLGPNGAG
ncbi:MAG: lysozyme, partial [Cyanobacteria bacterium J06659_2]